MAMASKDETATGQADARRRTIMLALIGAGLLVFTLANIHLVYVSVSFQPSCVQHSKGPGQAPGVYRAAKSSC
jgi:hypothetical protein